MSQSKQISFEKAPEFYASLKASGKTLVQCHGTFDLIHPGHITHFEEAKAHGDLLVVTLTAEDFVNKGPGRPYFNDEMRVKSLAALECVDYVTVIPFPAAVEAIECVQPDVYCKGREYSTPANDVTGNIHDDLAAVEACGGRMEYVGSIVFSSTKLINNHFDALPDSVKEHCQALSNQICPDDFKEAVDAFGRLKILVVGDVIFDRYSFVGVQGLTSKNRTLSTRFINEETYAGGSLAVYRHLRSFSDGVDFFSITGSEPWVAKSIDDYVPKERNHVFVHPEFTTVVKQRFIEKSIRNKELTKLFALNYIDAKAPNGDTEDRLCQKLEAIIEAYDLVVVTDFGHGLMQKKLRDLVQEKAKFLALNCQTNSNNNGFNIIDRQYSDVDAFSLDEQEILLSCGERHPDFSDALFELKKKLKASYSWLTRGANETIGINCSNRITHFPVLENQVTDTVGAGDALFALISMAASQHLPIELATFMGQLAGAQAVNISGNETAVRKDRLLKSGISLLSY